MLNISDKFKKLATAGGREPFCVIKAGDKLFFDDSIKSFELQEVIFPEELTFGTACSSRFQFQLYTEENIPLSAEIRPYIGFGEYSEEAELCPLGVFYISRRYRRFNNYSVTCYDRMYRLENTYSSKLSFPASSAALLKEICQEYSLEFTGECGDNICEKAPFNDTVRNVLGYLAGLDGCCARFDRDGKLCFRKIFQSGYRITRDNYTSMSLKQDPMEVRKLVLYNDDDTFEKGEGSRLDTYEIYNPFVTERTANLLYNEFGGFFYYGLELDMQGLPYLEAGDIITVQNDTDDGVFTAVIGELDFVYDGSFWASLSSRSKNPVEESEDMPGQEDELRKLEDLLQLVCYSYRSDRAVTVTTGLASLSQVNLQAYSNTSAIVGAQLMARAVSDCTLTIKLTVEDGEVPPPIKVTLTAGELFPVCIHNFLQSVPAGYITVRIWGSTDGGAVVFGARDIVMTVTGQHLAAVSLNRSPNRTIYEDFHALRLEESQQISIPFHERFTTGTQVPVPITPADRIGLALSGSQELRIGFTDSGYAPEDVHHIRIYSYDNVVYGEIVFNNPVYSGNFEALVSAFTFRIYFNEEDTVEYETADVQWDGNTVLTIASKTKFVGTTQVRVRYDASKGDLVCGLNGNEIESFNIAGQVEELV